LEVLSRIIFLLAILVIQLPAAAQVAPPADINVRGDRTWRKQGFMNGNLLGIVYFNTGQVSKDKVFPQLEWPVGSGHIYMDTVIPIAAAEATDEDGNLIHPLEANYEFSLDVSPDGLTEWGWQPLPNYSNPNQPAPAISNKPNTWPEIWPDRPEFGGEWNGFFGRGVLSADQETYYVIDDDADEEWKFFPDSRDMDRRGLGLRMSVRGLQWAQVLAEDAIFWVFDVMNVGTTDYENVVFGMFIDSKNGGHDFDNGFYNTDIDITYVWDQTGIGTWGGPTGWIGYGYLESPGIGTDGIDNDSDQLTDERRDSGPGQFGFGPVGIYGPPKDHWFGDEDGDWNQETDDVGEDGVGPLSPNWTGSDRGEGDGIPTDGEPNFDRTDLDESDQIGLEAVSLHPLGEFPLHEDERIWDLLANKTRDEVQNFSNIGVLYSSGPFPLAAGQSERFSIALLMGADFDDLIRNKEIVQGIFDADYRFARPPDKPIARATSGDGYVTLTWDNRAEFSRDPFLGIDEDGLGWVKDFEGYAIYRSTDPGLLDPRLITDAFGNTTFRKSEARFDLVNGIRGTDPIGLPSGAHFNLGDDTGLAHSWTDTNVVNGQTYYYAVSAYDRGAPDLGSSGLSPSETPTIIEQDILGGIVTDVNTIVVTPGVPAAGFTNAEIQSPPAHIEGSGSGEVDVEILFPADLIESSKYRVTFRTGLDASVSPYVWSTESYSVTLLPNQVAVDESPYLAVGDRYPIFDGLGLAFENGMISYDPTQSGHFEGPSDYAIDVMADITETGPTAGIGGLYPADYEIVFKSGTQATSRGGELGLPEIPVNFTVYNRTDEAFVDFLFIDPDESGTVTDGDDVIPLVAVEKQDPFPRLDYRTTWRVRFDAPSGGGTAPNDGDVYIIRTSKPLSESDVFEFETGSGAGVDQAKAQSELDQIAVVPNPYIVTTSIEPRNNLSSGRGERIIQFIHLPQQCTIQIFTIRGQLVDTIEHTSAIDNGVANWDLVSKDGINVSYGVYIYHVNAPGIGERIGRFALIK
jgi:hypothetical protein